MKVLITGGSHVASLHAGWKRLQQSGAWPDDLDITIMPFGRKLAGVGKFFDVQGDRVIITHDDYRRRIANLSRRETPFDAIGVSSPFHSRGLWMRGDWPQFCVPPLVTGRAPLTRALIDRCIRDHNSHVVDFLRALKSVGFDAFAIEGPKPFRHNPEIRRAGAKTVQYIDREYTRYTHETLQSVGVPALLMPAQTYDADGFCRAEFRHSNSNDTHHGNGALGEIMMQEIVRFLRRQTPTGRS